MYLYNYVHIIFMIIFYVWRGDGVDAEQLMSVAFQSNGQFLFLL